MAVEKLPQNYAEETINKLKDSDCPKNTTFNLWFCIFDHDSAIKKK